MEYLATPVSFLDYCWLKLHEGSQASLQQISIWFNFKFTYTLMAFEGIMISLTDSSVSWTKYTSGHSQSLEEYVKFQLGFSLQQN